MKKNVKVVAVVCLSAITFFSNGCGSGSVTNIKTALKPGDLNRQQTLLVKDFDTTNTAFSGDNAEDVNIVKSQKKRISSTITVSLFSKLRQNGFEVHNFDEKNIPQDAVVIDGVVTHVSHGSGAARYIVGFGAGAAWMKTTVKIYKAQSPNEVLAEFQVESSTEALVSPGDMTDKFVSDLAKAIVDYITSNS